MAKQMSGNGSSKVHIHQEDMGGWLRVYTDTAASEPAHLGFYLSHALADWFRKRPHLHVQAIVPICRDGNTVELHAWFGAHAFPAGGQEPG